MNLIYPFLLYRLTIEMERIPDTEIFPLNDRKRQDDIVAPNGTPSFQGVAVLNKVHHLLDLFRACEPRWLFLGEPIPKRREVIRPAQ